jgi:hypothetical protein
LLLWAVVVGVVVVIHLLPLQKVVVLAVVVMVNTLATRLQQHPAQEHRDKVIVVVLDLAQLQLPNPLVVEEAQELLAYLHAILLEVMVAQE